MSRHRFAQKAHEGNTTTFLGVHPNNLIACLAGLAACLAFALVVGLIACAGAVAAEGPELPEDQSEYPGLEPEEDVGSSEYTEGVIPGSYIVVLKNTVARPAEVANRQAEQRNGKLRRVYHSALDGYSISGLTRDDVAALRRDPRVKYVEPNVKIQLEEQSVPTGISRIFATGNTALDIDGIDDARINVDVAILDARIDYTHPDLNVVQRIDCVNADKEHPCVADTGNVFKKRHGTWVAGIIGAIDNGSGVVGVAPGARLWGIRIFGDDGESDLDWTLAGIDWVTAHASEIEAANMSIGAAGRSRAEDEAISAAVNAGVVTVVAAGNESENAEARRPADSPDAISVSAIADYDGLAGGLAGKSQKSGCYSVGADDALGTFSDWGSGVEIAAPGVCMLSTDAGGGYANVTYGTSFSAPHVTGAAAVLASKSNPGSKEAVDAIRQQLIEGGSLDWNDTSEDGAPEPLLYLGNTPLTKPEVATGGWSTSDGRTATITGSLNARGFEAEYQFEYGPTTSYGTSAPLGPRSLGGQAEYTVVSEAITGLEPRHTYHYRLKVTTSAGTIYGQDRTINTSSVFTQKRASFPGGGPIDSEALNGLSCPTAQFCMAATYYRSDSDGDGNSDGNSGSYKLENGQWKFAATLPVPTESRNVHVYGLFCSSSSACTAVGTAERLRAGEIKYDTVPLAERWNGTSWSPQSVPVPYPGKRSFLHDVACTSTSECIAVGGTENSEGVNVTYATRWNGGVWTNMSTPNGTGSTGGRLEGVSCLSASSCTAVGWYNTGKGSYPMSMSWNGATWSLQTPDSNSAGFQGINCLSGSFCVAVGNGLSIQAWDGSKWSSQSPELPPDNRGGSFEDVSCVTSSYCKAVGYVWGQNRADAIVETWDGASWKMETVPRDAEKWTNLTRVRCVVLTGCVMIGGAKEEDWDSWFLTPDGVMTAPPSGVSPGQATLRGTVNPGGVSTTYKFEYGKTTAYGTSVPTSGASVGAGVSPVEVSQTIKELEPETTYHYRLMATNTNGTTVYSADATFRTSTPPYHFVQTIGSSGTGKTGLDRPFGVEVDKEGYLWVADHDNNRVDKYSSSGQFVLMVGGEVDKTTHANICTASSGHECGIGIAGSGNGQFKEPLDVAITSANEVWVTDGGNNRVQKLNSEGTYLSKFGSSGSGNGQFSEPWGIDVASNGDIWVVDALRSRVQKFTSAGSFVLSVTGFSGPRGLAIDAGDHVWVTERSTNQVFELSPSGEKLSQFGGAGAGGGWFDEPQGIDVKSSGDLLVIDRFNELAQQFSSTGAFVNQVGTGNEPRGVASSEGTLYVSSSWSDRVEQWQQYVPRAVTGSATALTSGGATLGGTVNPRSVATEYRFEYGKTTAYGTSTANESAGTGTSDLPVTKAVSGLEPSTTYHFRLVAISAEGTIYGADKIFTTKASVANGLSSMSVTEPFNGSTESLANFGSKWSAMGWAGGGTPKGLDQTTGWRPSESYPTVSGASYNTSVSDSGEGSASVVTMATNPGNASRYLSLWLDMPTPTGVKAGYELRFTVSSANVYTVTMSKWASGSQTTLASKASFSFSDGGSVALVDQGGTVSAWTNSGSGFSQLLSASDSSFSSGTTGVEGAGNVTHLTNFKVGSLPK